MNYLITRTSLLLGATIMALSIIACDDTSNTNQDPPETDKDASVSNEDASDSSMSTSVSTAMIITTDYQSGSIATIDLDDLSVTKNVQVIHSDSVCRFDPVTNLPYIISRMGSDAITIMDSENGWSVITQYSVGAGTNAQDIAVASSDRAYVPRFGDSNLLVVDPASGDELNKIDLSKYADDDGNPNAAMAYHVNGEIFVGLQRIDETWTPTDYSSVVVVDVNDDSIVEEIKLTAKNPVGKLRYSNAVNSLVFIEAGVFGAMDGGIEYLNPVTHKVSGLVITEETLGGDVTDAVIVTKNKGYAIIGVKEGETSSTRLVSFNPSTGKKLKELIVSDGWDLSYLAITPDNSELWISNRTMGTPGVRIFSTTNDKELTDSPIDVGLPPGMVCFVK